MPGPGPGGYEPGGICGYYDYEVIHDPIGGLAAPVYDFLYGYLHAHPHPHAVELGVSCCRISTVVFKRFIDIGLVRGGYSGNWNVNGWACILPAILALEPNSHYPNGKGVEHYLSLYTTTTTPYHQALPDMVKEYDPITGLRHEAPGYSFGTIGSLLDFSYPVGRAGTNTIAGNDMLRRASLAMIGYITFERLLTYYTATGNQANAARASQVLENAIAAGQYSRQNLGWANLIAAEDLNGGGIASASIRTAYSAHHRHVTLKNNNDIQTGLMATLYSGRRGDHLNSNGIALQLYGQGGQSRAQREGIRVKLDRRLQVPQRPGGSQHHRARLRRRPRKRRGRPTRSRSRGRS